MKWRPARDTNYLPTWPISPTASRTNSTKRSAIGCAGLGSLMIGIRYWGVDPGAFVRYHPPQLGGNVRVCLDGNPGINVDAAVLDTGAPKVGSLPSWRVGSLKDRVDAVIAHEYAEVLAPPVVDFHIHALTTAEFTPLTITDRARQILREYRQAEGY